MKFSFDRLDGLHFLGMTPRQGAALVEAGVPGGHGYAYPGGIQAQAYGLRAAITGGCDEDVARRVAQLEELLQNPAFKFHYIQFPLQFSQKDGWYVAGGLQHEIGDDEGTAYTFNIDLRKVGSDSDKRLAVTWESAEEDYTWTNALDALEMIALPHGAENIAWAIDSTRTGRNGANAILIDPTRQTILFHVDSIRNSWKAEARAFDILTDGQVWRAFAAWHKFEGALDIDNGLIRYQENTQRFFVWNTFLAEPDWTNLGHLNIRIGGVLTSVVHWQLTDVSPDAIEWEEIRMLDEDPIRLQFSLRRGSYACRVRVLTFSAEIADDIYVCLEDDSLYPQMFNASDNGAAGGGDLTTDADHNYHCGYSTGRDVIGGFVLLDEPAFQPPDAGPDKLAEGNTWTEGDEHTFFVMGWPQETNPFVIATARAQADQIAQECMYLVTQEVHPVDRKDYQ